MAERRRAFLKVLGETGNFSLAVERAKVSRSWATLHRKRDAEFDAACRGALAEAKAALLLRSSNSRTSPLLAQPSAESSSPPRERGGNGPPGGWGFHRGEALVVRGTGDGVGGRRVQVARARLKQWDGPTEDRFLEALAATCNVRASCAAVGLTVASAYKHRYRWPAFGRRWDKVVEMASEELQRGLIQAGRNLFASPEEELPLDVPITGMTAEQALLLLRLHRQGVKGGRRAPGRPPSVATNAEVRAALLKTIEQLKAQQARREARERRRTERSGGE